MSNNSRIPNEREIKGPVNRIRTMEVFDLTGDQTDVFVTLTSKRDITQARSVSAEKLRKSRANISPWAKDKLK